MDSISQFVLGASVSEVSIGKKIGNKALIWGGLIGTLPDLDVIPGSYMLPLDSIEFHRGPTHSLFFCFLCALPFAKIIQWFHKKSNLSFKEAYWSCFFIFFTHAILDMCTTWGTKFLWPISDIAVAWQIIFVVDPIYTVPFLIILLIILFIKKESLFRRKLNYGVLVFTSIYLTLNIFIKTSQHHSFNNYLNKHSKENILTLSSRPAPLTNLLWTANAQTENTHLIAYKSVFEGYEKIEHLSLDKNHSLRLKWKDQSQFKQLVKISQNQYYLKPHPKGIIFCDLRFGLASAWALEGNEFVFSYLLKGKPSDSYVEVVKKEPSFKNRKDILKTLIDRIL